MSDMVKRVAEAISEARTGNSLSWRNFVAEAQAAIAAMQADAASVATSDRQDAIEAAQDVLAGRGNGTYDEALDAIRWLLQSAGIYDAPVAMVRVTNSGYAMSLAQYVAYSLPEGDHWLYTHPPVDNRVSTSSPVDDREPENTSDKADTAPAVKSDTVLVSNKLRSAVEVWRDAYDAFTDFYCHTTEKDAAAVIEAYVQERLAAKDADFEKLKRAWKIQYDEKVKERAEARLWFEKAQQWRQEFASHVTNPSQDWKPMTDTAWLDGRDVVLFANGMEIHARYCPGEWREDTPVAPAEYSGAVWSAFDDQIQFEIEETSDNASEWLHGPVTYWREANPPKNQGTPT